MNLSPSPGEFDAAALALGSGSQPLVAIRLPGPLQTAESILTELRGMLPNLAGRNPPVLLDLNWEGAGGAHPAALYEADEGGGLLVVSHESGPLVFFPWIEAAAAAAGLLQAAYMIV